MKKWIKGMTAAGIASALLLAGCGGESKEEGKEAKGQEAKKYQIGVTQLVEHPSLDNAYKGFKKALEDAGIEADYDVQIAQGDQNNNQTIANNFAGDKVDLIFANSTPSATGALNATKDIPIIFTSVTDPKAAGLVKDTEKPGGNITGTTDLHPDAIPKTIEFMSKEFKGKRVGVIYNAGEQNSVAQVESVKKVMEKNGLKLVPVTVSSSSEVKQAAESLAGKADMIYIVTDNTVVSALESVVQVANQKDIPLFVGELDSVKRGGFAAFGFEYYDIGYEAGEMAAKVLKDGEKPGDMPVQPPQNLKLLINEKAAKEMNIEIKDEWKKEAEFVKE
ncbi:ABC transporter substrate-binding protein [Pseudobacillus badius]|uniref:ABC transporter substrate-binding protein n=1 Tax=Bacillus badius TaxID=1455 RepID=UPI0007B038F4|nr:ABC transporter substrate-binding protein [Bacillus badius]KZN99035.1 BMP family ABC transporter substrate-binding protein [Bacillus badius]MED0664976.1 ABC transporter substrate-binding protein [Bacillus badius]OCS83974.1 BMP family ABC transporter substrate-binding protein [Bacillus badius]OVE52732.1 BMP family ABC transporter substrate-binding protein [Bacillus badius]TDW04750.1 putative ABC transport system substrate-binding protein [Bacillus badius]